jgi:homoserine dehydrogenase
MKIGLLGMGTVGTGVLKVLSENYEKISRLTAENIEVTHAVVNDMNKEREVDVSGIQLTENIEDLLNADIDIVIEVMGGIETTRDVLIQFLNQGKHVISANKDMLAKHIDELTEAANKNNVAMLYEASVAGGVPIIRTIESSLNANEISEVMGILNGTTNYILSKMTIDGWDYERALQEAQAKGYAEADPTNDVEGIDALRKIVLLSRLSYNRQVNIDEIETAGISNVDVDDLKIAKKQGLIMKLVGKSKFHDEELSISVEPVLLPESHQLASVNYEKNAVYVIGNVVGETMYYGPGAGSLETASAIVSDLINILTYPSHYNFIPEEKAQIKNVSDSTRYFIHAENSADEEAINGEIIAEDQGVTFITPEISHEALEQLREQLDIKACYQVIGVE